MGDYKHRGAKNEMSRIAINETIQRNERRSRQIRIATSVVVFLIFDFIEAVFQG